MEKIPAATPQPVTQPPERVISAPTPSPSRFGEMLDDLGTDLDRGQQMMARVVRSGAQMSAQQLLAVQAGIYRYSETLELAAKVVDKASNAVRTTLQSQ